MPRIPYPESEEGPVWDEIRAARGRVSKTFRLLGHSPLVQKLTLTKSETLEKRGVLGHRFHEAVAYTVSTQNGCLR